MQRFRRCHSPGLSRCGFVVVGTMTLTPHSETPQHTSEGQRKSRTHFTNHLIGTLGLTKVFVENFALSFVVYLEELSSRNLILRLRLVLMEL